MKTVHFYHRRASYANRSLYRKATLLVVPLSLFLFLHVMQLYGAKRVEEMRYYVSEVDIHATHCRERLSAYWTGRIWNERVAFGRKYAKDSVIGWLVNDVWLHTSFIDEVDWRSAKFDCER